MDGLHICPAWQLRRWGVLLLQLLQLLGLARFMA